MKMLYWAERRVNALGNEARLAFEYNLHHGLSAQSNAGGLNGKSNMNGPGVVVG